MRRLLSALRPGPGRVRWLPLGAAAALAPKCVLCLGAYAGVGALLGLRLGPEFCRAPADPPKAAVAAGLTAAALALIALQPLAARLVRRWPWHP